MLTRRRFVALSTAVVTAPRFSSALPSVPVVHRLYIGTDDSGPGKGIMTATWDAASGTIGAPSLAAEVSGPTFLAQYRRPGAIQTLVYAVSERPGTNAQVSAYTTVAGSPALKLLNRVSTQGDEPTYVSVSPDGRTVLVANYGGGSVSTFRTAPDGSLSEAVSHVQFSGSGPYKGRQEGPHAHSALTSPDGRFVLVNDLGLDRIFLFELNAATSEITPAATPFWQGRPASGPRHLAWSPNGRFVYCTNELDSTVETLAWSEHPVSLRSVGRVSTLPPGFAPDTAFVGEVVASSDGRNVYAGNRVADDTIAVFRVDSATGVLTPIQFAPSEGLNSRHLALDPSGKWMIAAHQKSGELTVLARDRATGKLSSTGRSVPVEKPMCVLFR